VQELTLRWVEKLSAPARPTWSSTPHPPAEGFAACRHYCPSPGPGDIGSPGGAGLTSKPHRDRSTRKISSFPDRHARPEPGIRKRRDVGPLLPADGFARYGSLRRCASAIHFR